MENTEGVNSEEEETTVQKDRKRKFDTDLKRIELPTAGPVPDSAKCSP